MSLSLAWGNLCRFDDFLLEKAVVEYPKIPRECFPVNFAVKPIDTFAKSEVFGEPTKATGDKGERLLSASVPRIVDFGSLQITIIKFSRIIILRGQIHLPNYVKYSTP